MSLVQNVHRIKIGNDLEASSRHRGAYRSPSSSSSASSSSSTISSPSLRKREQRWREHQRGSSKSKLAHKIVSATKDSHRKNAETSSSTTTSYSSNVSDSESDTSRESSLDALVQRALSIPENKWLSNREYKKNMKNERSMSGLFLDSKYNRNREHELKYRGGNRPTRNNNYNNYFMNANNISSKNDKNKLYDSNHVNTENNICREKQNREDSDGVDVVSAHYIDRQSNNKQIDKRRNVNNRAFDDKQNRSASRYKVNGKLSLAILNNNNNSMGNNNEYNFTDINNSKYGGNEEDDFRFTRMLEELRLNAEKRQGKFVSTNEKSKTPSHKERVDKHGKRHAAIKFDKAMEARLTSLNASARAKKQEKYEVRKAKEQEEEKTRNNKTNSEHNKFSSPQSKRSIEAGERLYRLATSKEALLTRMRKEANEEQNKAITKELTFKPTISKMAQELVSKDYQPLSLRSSAEFNTQMQRRRHSQLAQESRKLRQCTFHPTLAPFTEQIIHARRQKEMRKWCARHNRKLHHANRKTHRHSNSWRAKHSDISDMHQRTSPLSSTSSSSSSSSSEYSNKARVMENHKSGRLRGMNRANDNNKKRNADHSNNRNHNANHFSSHSPFKETSSLHHHHHHKNKGLESKTSHLYLNDTRRTAAAHLSSSYSRALLSSSTCHEPFDPAERLYHDGEERLLRQQIRQQMALDRAEAEMVGNHIKLSHDELQEVLARMEDWLCKRNQRVAIMREEIIRTETRNPLHDTESVSQSASCAPRIGAHYTISPCSPLSSSSSLTEQQQEKEQQMAVKVKHDPLRRSATEFTHLQQSNTHQEQLHKAKKQGQEYLENGSYRNTVMDKVQHDPEGQTNNTSTLQEQKQTKEARDDVLLEEKHTKDKYRISCRNKLMPSSSKNTIYKNGAAMPHHDTEHLSQSPVLATAENRLWNIVKNNDHNSDAAISPVSESSESTSPYGEITSSNKEQKQENRTASNKDHTSCVQYNHTQWTKAQWELRVIRYGALFYKYLPSTSTNTVRLSEIESQVHRIYPEDENLLAVLQARFGLPETVIDKEMFVSALTEFERNNGPQPWGWTEKDRLLYNPIINNHDDSNNRTSSVYLDRKRITFPTIDSTTHHTHQDEGTSGKEELTKNNKVNTSLKWRSARMPHACKRAVRVNYTPAFKHSQEQHERITRAKQTKVHDDKCTFKPKLNKRSIQLSNEDKRKRAMKINASLSRKIDVSKTIDKQTCTYTDLDTIDVDNGKNDIHSAKNAQASTMPSAQLTNETKRVSSSSHRAGLSPSVELSSLSSTEEYELLNNNINNDLATTKSNKVTNTSKDASKTLHSSVREWQHATKTTHDAVAELEFLLQSTQERVNALMQLEQANYDNDGNIFTNMYNATRESLPSQITDTTQSPHHSSKEVRNRKISSRNGSNNNTEKCVQEEQKIDDLSPTPSKPELTTVLEKDNTKHLSNKQVNSKSIMTDTFDNLFDSLYKSCSRSTKRS